MWKAGTRMLIMTAAGIGKSENSNNGGKVSTAFSLSLSKLTTLILFLYSTNSTLSVLC
jgi:hypothetical protein